MNDVTTGGPGFVAVGIDWADGDTVAAVWTSVDGLEWQRVQHDESVFGGAGNQWMNAVSVGGPGLVAVGAEWKDDEGVAAVWTSTDGLRWQRVPHNQSTFGSSFDKSDLVDVEMEAVVQGGPGLVAVGTDQIPNLVGHAVVWTSTDGFNWKRVKHDNDIFHDKNVVEMLGVAAGDEGLVAVGSSGDFGAAVWTSTDGMTWQRVPHNDEIFGKLWPVMRDVTAGGPGFVAVGYDILKGDSVAAVWTSKDRATWQRIPHQRMFSGSSSVSMNAVAAGGPGLVAVGFDAAKNAAAVWTSVDGIDWNRLPHEKNVFGSDESQSMYDVTAGGPKFIAVGSTTQRKDQDAVVWTAKIESP